MPPRTKVAPASPLVVGDTVALAMLREGDSEVFRVTNPMGFDFSIVVTDADTGNGSTEMVPLAVIISAEVINRLRIDDALAGLKTARRKAA